MKQRTLELWVGLFVTLGLVALIFLSLRVAGSNNLPSSGKNYTVYAEFSDIGGLKVKAPVKTAGVVVGRVSAISLDPTSYRAKVAIELAESYHFSNDASAQILTSGILGEQYIGLQEGSDEDKLQHGDTITLTSSALVLENLIGKFITDFAEKNTQQQ